MLTNWLIEHYNHMKVIHFILRQVYEVRIAGEIPQHAWEWSQGKRNYNVEPDPNRGEK